MRPSRTSQTRPSSEPSGSRLSAPSTRNSVRASTLSPQSISSSRTIWAAREALVDVAQPLLDALVAEVGPAGQDRDRGPQLDVLGHEQAQLRQVAAVVGIDRVPRPARRRPSAPRRPLPPPALALGHEAVLLGGLALGTPARSSRGRPAPVRPTPMPRLGDRGEPPRDALVAAGRAGRGGPGRDKLLEPSAAGVAAELVDGHPSKRICEVTERTAGDAGPREPSLARKQGATRAPHASRPRTPPGDGLSRPCYQR